MLPFLLCHCLYHALPSALHALFPPPSSFSVYSNPTHHLRPTLPSFPAVIIIWTSFCALTTTCRLIFHGALRVESHCSGHQLKESNSRHLAVLLFHHLYEQAMNAIRPERVQVCWRIPLKTCMNRFESSLSWQRCIPFIQSGQASCWWYWHKEWYWELI